MLARVLSGAVIGIDAYRVEVEVDISRGLPMYATVGLPDAAVRESRERVKSAVVNSGYLFPDDRITVNLAPAHIRKEGPGFDLPIATGILAATRVIPSSAMNDFLILGELSLDGRVKPVKGSLSMALAARDAGLKGVIVPAENAPESAAVKGVSVYPARTLHQVADFLRGTSPIRPQKNDVRALFESENPNGSRPDFSEVKGQEHMKRALEVAAAGGHNVIMIGPPGSGKTMLAKRMPGILPPLSFDEALETTRVFSVAGLLERGQALVRQRPFRSPHHTISDAGLIGGGQNPRPGEVSLAHNGTLFLDELPEFKKNALEVLRQPLEDLRVTIARAASTVTYPAAFMLLAAMNPCPCGFYSDPRHECRCSARRIQRYRSKISGPLLDRLDIHLEAPAVDYRDLAGEPAGETSAEIRKRVTAARRVQSERFAQSPGIHCNAQMASRHIRRHCEINGASLNLLEAAMEKLGLSARAYTRILKISRTIADLDGEKRVLPAHIAEAVQYRGLDRGKRAA